MKDTKTNGTSGIEKPNAKEPRQQQTPCQGANGYEIRVRDHLDTYWHKRFDGWSVTNLENGEILLKSTGVDQSKLHGALNQVRDLNLTLLEVKCIPVDDETVPPGTSGGQAPAPNHR